MLSTWQVYCLGEAKALAVRIITSPAWFIVLAYIFIVLQKMLNNKLIILHPKKHLAFILNGKNCNFLLTMSVYADVNVNGER